MITAADCPSKEQLSQYTLGTLQEDFVPGLESHLDTCHTCCKTIRQLESQTDSFTEILRIGQAVQTDPLLNETPFLSVMASLSRIGIEADKMSKGIRREARSIQSMAPSGPQPGQTLGQYLLLGVVGQGGMGLVFKARHKKLDKIVALKLLSAARVHDPQMQLRFHREMRAAGSIDHPNVVRALDADEVDGVHFLVMEFVDGLDLSALLKQMGPVSVRNACSIIRMAADGLSEIHQAGMVHRDVKPGNLMLSRDGVVKILDLGLALLHPSHLPLDDDLTSASQLMGTVDYMAPEQADNTHEVDFRADIYGLGATLFALLTGRSPLGDRQQTLMKKLSVLANSTAPSIREFRDDVPEDLAELVSRMLNRDRGLRPASAAEVALALEKYASNDGLSELVAGCSHAADGDVFTHRTDSVYDTMILSPDTGCATVSHDAAAEELTAVTSSRLNWKAPLLIFLSVLLTGTFWLLSQSGHSLFVTDDPKLAEENLAINPQQARNNIAALATNSPDPSTARSSTSESVPRSMADLTTISLSPATGTSESTNTVPWGIFASDAEPDLRTDAIHRAVEIIPVEHLVRQLFAEQNASLRAGLLLAISEFEQAKVLSCVNTIEKSGTAESKSMDLIETLLHWYVKEPDPEVHASVEVLLRRWGLHDRIQELRPIVEQKLIPFEGGWYQPLHVSAMVVIPGPRTEQLGSPADEPGRFTSELQMEDLHTVNIPYTFAICSTEVTRCQFWRTQKDYWKSSPPADPDLPANDVLWGQAAEFCNRLSLLEGLNEDDLCYFPIGSGRSTQWRQKPNALQLGGYRLPTDDEWETACRAGTRTSRPVGEDLTWIDHYCVSTSTGNHPLNVASHKPNPFGLFDMLGNVSEWIHSDMDHAEIEKGRRRIRGGSAWSTPSTLRSASRFHYPSRETSLKVGFRVARTILRKPLQSDGPGDILSRVEIQVGPPASTPKTTAYVDPEYTPLLDQQVVRFGTWDARTPPSRAFRLRNKSDQPLQLSHLPWMFGVFVVETTDPLLIPPNGIADFRIRIPIGRVGEHTHDLQFRWEGIKESDCPAIRLHGCLQGPLLDLMSLGRFGSESRGANLGRIPRNSQSGIRPFVLNVGDQPVEASVTNVTGPFVIVDPLEGLLVPHVLEKSFRVVLTASSLGPVSGTITLQTKQNPPAEFTFPVQAEVIDSEAFSSIGVFRNGTWMIDHNRDAVIDESIEFGTFGDHPLTGDWNGDGICDIAVWRKVGDGTILIQFRLRGNPAPSPLLVHEIQLESDQWIPVAADLDGDGTSEIGYVSSPVPGEGMIWAFDTQHDQTFSHRFTFGFPDSDPVTGDWNGDGIDEVAASFHGKSAPAGTRLWQIQHVGDAQPKERVFLSHLDLPLAGDWDGDGDDDLCGWRPPAELAPSVWQFETSGDTYNECDLEGLGIHSDIPFVLRRNLKRADAQ